MAALQPPHPALQDQKHSLSPQPSIGSMQSQNQYLDEKKHMEAYQMIIRIMETPHLDNTKPLKHLIYPKDDQLPLYESATMNQVSIDVLKKKIVLLLISDLDLPADEIQVLGQMYYEARLNPTRAGSQYEVVWIPVVPNHKATPWTQENKSKFEELRNMMPWYSVFHPSLLDPASIKYIKEVWHFNHKPLLVVMDPQGRIINTNALNMMWIWASVAFPFTRVREETLWLEETWRIELLVDSIEQSILTWVDEGKYICLYGGEDLEWIRKFTRTAQAVAHEVGIQLEMLYVGKSNSREKVRKNNDIIRVEKLGHMLVDLTKIWFFWVRLERMLHSKLQHGKSFDEDPILCEIDMMLTYDGNNQGWAVICYGSNDWTRVSDGLTFLTCLNKYSEWQDEAQSMGFLSTLNQHLEANRPPMAPILRFSKRFEQYMFSSSDDDAMMKNILATHAPDGTYFDVNPLLQIIEDITHRVNLDTGPHGTQPEIDAIVESVIFNDVSEMLEAMALPSNKVSYKGIGGVDAHATTTVIFRMLSRYEWDVKAIITLASFMMNYGELWLVVQLCVSNPLAKSRAHVKQVHDVLEQDEAFKPRFEAGTNLFKAMLDLTRCVVQFKDLPKQYISPDTFELVTTTTTHIPTAVYWIIRSIVACASILINLTETVDEYVTATTEAWELSCLEHKISNIHDHLKRQFDLHNHHINERKQIEAYQMIVRVMETPHLDNTKPLKQLIYLKDDQLPLYDGRTKNRVSIDILKKKMVLLLISDLDFPLMELLVLDQIFQEARQNPTRGESQFEILWLPVVPNATPWTQENQSEFKELRNIMPWYSVFDPSLLDPLVIKYIKEVWRFNHKPVLVAMDPQGRIVNTNAIHMLWIWGSVAFPFTSMREEALWREETWRIELLADSIEPNILSWVDEGKYICLYGGEDLEWIRKFTTTAKAVARKARIQLEMLYVGKNNRSVTVRRNNDIILSENLSHVLLDPTQIWFFWARLESMLYSKLQLGKSFDEDPILREIMVMLTYDGNEQGWAVICSRSNDWMRSDGIMVLRSLTFFSEWEDLAIHKGFLPALNEYLQANWLPQHCNRLVLPDTTGNVPVCTDCGRSMERFFLYRCCTD